MNAVVWLYSRRELRPLATIYLLVSGANAAFSVTFVLYVQYRYHWSLGRTGAILAVSSLLDIVVQSLLVGPMIRRFGERVTLVGGLIAGSLGYGCMGLAENGALFTLALVPLGLMMVVAPAIQSSMSQCVSESEQGRLQGSVVSTSCVAAALAPILFGKVYSSTAGGSIGETHPGEAFLVAALILLVVAAGAAATHERAPDLG
jgi:DHA1 family tetracycline resistance protein-like MFS transporter